MKIIEEIFSKELPEVLVGYEKRLEQEKMAQYVFDALSKEKHLFVEAGTGVGKSIAYLIPAIIWSLENDERVVISTYTKNLQDQLLKKDIPVLEKLFSKKNLNFSAIVIKGRSNYICLRKLENYKNILGLGETENTQMTFLDDELEKSQEELKGILKELENKHNGERENFKTPITTKVWREICGDIDTCLKWRCPWRKKCYINNLRISAAQKNLILVNHALFFSDLAIKTEGGNSVLPEYKRVIIDEAHHIEDIACDNMALSIDKIKIKAYITSLFSGSGEVPQRIRSDETYYEKIKIFNKNIERYLDDLFLEIENFLKEEQSIRYKTPVFNNTEIIKELEKVMLMISSENFAMSLNLTDEGEGELETFINRGMSLLQELKFLLEVKFSEQYVYWVERSTYGKEEISLKAAPIRVSAILQESLFSKTPVILTSATLSTGGDFSYIAKRIGIDSYEGKILDSPFDYEKNCLLFVPQNALSPKDDRYYEYVAFMSKEILNITKGNAFLLFTSYKAMNYCYNVLKEDLYDIGCQIFIQTPEKPVSLLLEEFKSAENPILFGTNSFWEGVDVPGEKLSCVIVTKLPFSVPTRPIEKARVEALKKEGINDFLNYSVPKACIRLKQGFGRLIRSKTDKGIVAILDPRILSMGYGQIFLDSLPKTARNKALGAVKKFIKNRC